MNNWINTLRRGLTRKQSRDRVNKREGEINTRSNLKNLRRFFLRHWRKGVLGVILVILTSLLTFPGPLITRYLIDDVILAGALNKLWIGLILLLGVKLLSMAMSMFEHYFFTRFEQAVILDIQSDLFERLLHFPKSFFDETEIGYLMSRIQQDVHGVQLFFSQTIVYTLTSILRFLGGVGLLFYLEWRLALCVLVLLPFIVLGLNYFSRKMRILSNEQMEQQANVSRSLQESLSTTTLIKTYSTEKRTVGRMVSEWKAAQQLSLEQITVGSLANLIIGILPSLANGISFIAGAYWIIQGEWTFGSLTAFQSYLGYVYGPAMALASTNLQLQTALAALARVSALFAIVPEENQEEASAIPRLNGELEFQKVTFSYNGRDAVLEDISFHIKGGEQIAIIGPSGVGKTTLISLILQFYRPGNGKIFFDGMEASQIELSSLRSRIGYVSQATLLLEGTFRENLTYGKPDATQTEIEKAATVAGIHDFIHTLPEGYNSLIGERGVNLSEGQKQRLSIARALIKDPDILVLDEPTSSLDQHLEVSIFTALPELLKGKTVFVIAHRLSTIRRADRILILREKRLEDIGTHNELMDRSEYYRSLFIKES